MLSLPPPPHYSSAALHHSLQKSPSSNGWNSKRHVVTRKLSFTAGTSVQMLPVTVFSQSHVCWAKLNKCTVNVHVFSLNHIFLTTFLFRLNGSQSFSQNLQSNLLLLNPKFSFFVSVAAFTRKKRLIRIKRRHENTPFGIRSDSFGSECPSDGDRRVLPIVDPMVVRVNRSFWPYHLQLHWKRLSAWFGKHWTEIKRQWRVTRGKWGGNFTLLFLTAPACNSFFCSHTQKCKVAPLHAEPRRELHGDGFS